jgi:hypothetical protein
MKNPVRIAFAVIMILSAISATAQSDARRSFDQLKALAGTWEGKNSQSEPMQVSFKVTSNGSAIMSEIIGHGENMVSMIHFDGPNKLMLTHYCAAKNQPRMVASPSADGKTITFNFLDATNLATPDAGHMSRVAITILDADHHQEEWTFADHGKEMKEVFDLHRKM